MPLTQVQSGMLASGAVTIASLSATGTPSASTFLRGDNAWADSGALGVGQTWQTPTRAAATTYTNSTGRPIFVCVGIAPTGSSNGYVDFLIDGTNTATWGQGSSASPSTFYYTAATFVIPSGSTYRANLSGNVNLYLWRELR